VAGSGMTAATAAAPTSGGPAVREGPTGPPLSTSARYFSTMMQVDELL
jgi:hypothetical protein